MLVLAVLVCCHQVLNHCLIVRLMLFLILVEKMSAGKAAKEDAERQRNGGPEEGTAKIVSLFLGFVLSYCVVSRPAHCSADAPSLMIMVH